MALDVATLRSSFDLVVSRVPNLTQRFYDVLFTRHPEVRPLFNRNSRDRQERMLTETLVALLDHLDDAPWLADNLQRLGAKHRDYNVTDEMYDWVGEALLVTLADAAGDEWVPATEAAWTEAFGAIASLMKAGARA